MFKRRLTLILKVDNLLTQRRVSAGERWTAKEGKPATHANNMFRSAERCASASVCCLRQLRQKHGEQSDRRQKRADVIDECDASMVGDPAENRSTETANPESESEKYSGDQPKTMRHQLLRKHDNG